MKIKERYFARKGMVKEIRDELSRISPAFSQLIDGKARMEVARTEEGVDIILVNGEPLIFQVRGRYFPTVRGALRLKPDRRYVVVDMGAVPYVVNGADIMRPGVVAYDEKIEKGDLVVVLEEKHNKAIAIGEALWSGEEFGKREKGKCVKNLHHVGDRIWKLEM